MLAKVKTAAVLGLEGHLVEVEVDISSGLPGMTIVGLPDAAVQEARERVRAAIRNSGYTFPMKRIVVNLAPADLKKAGPSYDLPIAVGILLSSEQISADTSQTIFLGELSLDGSLRHTSGILPMVAVAKEERIANIIVPEVDAKEAALIEGTRIIPIHSLSQLVSYFQGKIPTPEYKPDEFEQYSSTPFPTTDLAHM
jgi:magnesium chelatase family protein